MKKEKEKIQSITTPFFRASFAHVFKPHSGFKGVEPKFSVQMLFKKSEDLSVLKKAVARVKKKKWGESGPDEDMVYMSPFKDGNTKKLDDYKNMIIVEARSKYKPGIVDASGENEIIDPQEFYSGCWARATITPYAWEMAGKCGVSFALQNLQKFKDDKPFSGKKNAKDDFEALDELEDDEEFDETDEDDF
jgi:hypothetical protein